MSNFRIGFPDIPLQCASTSSAMYATAKPAANLITGSRERFGELATAITGSHYLQYDASAASLPCDYVALGRASVMAGSGVSTYNLRGSNYSYFKPSSVSGLTMWLDATRGLTYDSLNRVSQWADVSGAGITFTQSTDALKPVRTSINNNTALSFDGTDDTLTSTALTSALFTNNAKTAFIVFRPTILDGTIRIPITDSSATPFWGIRIPATNKLGFRNNDGAADEALSQNALSINTTYVGYMRHDAGTLYVNVLGQVEQSIASGNTTTLTNTVHIGARAGVNYYAGALCEIITYNVVVGASDIAAIYNYLSNKWQTAPLYTTNLTALDGPADEDLADVFGSATSSYYIQQFDSYTYFGQAFDFGREPLRGRVLSTEVHQDKGKRPALKFQFNWRGISNDKRNEFEAKIGLYGNESPVFILWDDYGKQMIDFLPIHAKILKYEFTPRPGSLNDVAITFEELI